MKADFNRTESNLAVSCNINEKHLNELILAKHKCWANKHYSRWKCLVISEIPESVQNNGLKECIIKPFNESNIPVDPANIEACYRLKSKAKSNKVIIKLSKREDI